MVFVLCKFFKKGRDRWTLSKGWRFSLTHWEKGTCLPPTNTFAEYFYSHCVGELLNPLQWTNGPLQLQRSANSGCCCRRCQFSPASTHAHTNTHTHTHISCTPLVHQDGVFVFVCLYSDSLSLLFNFSVQHSSPLRELQERLCLHSEAKLKRSAPNSGRPDKQKGEREREDDREVMKERGGGRKWKQKC